MKVRLCLLACAALAANFYLTSAHAAKPAPAAAMNCDASIVQGQRTSVAVTGEGPDVVLIPGLSTPRAVWDATVERLKGQYRLHVVQVHGFGDDAGANAVGPVLEPMAAELTAYISQCITGKGRTAPAIVGHSLGGLTALMIGAHAPDQTDKLMIVDAVPFIGTIFVPGATVAMMKPQATAMAARMRAQYGVAQPVAAGGDPGPASMAGTMSNSPAGRTLIAKWMRAADARVTGQLLYDDMTTDMRSELPKITAPVTLLYSQDDSAMPAAAAKAAFEPQYAGTPHFIAQMIPGSRHFIMLDQPAAFAKALDAFLAG